MTWSADVTLEALLGALHEAVLVYDEALRCRLASSRAAEILGLDPKECVGIERRELLRRIAARCDIPDPVLALGGPPTQPPPASPTSEPPRPLASTVELAGPGGATIVWTTTPLLRAGVRCGHVDVVRDVTAERAAEAELVQMERKLEEVSAIDALTGLATRRRFEQESDREHRRAQRAWDAYAIARIDIDGMSSLNDAIGREKGNEVLRGLAEELRSARREYDVVARWDGDEFILLLPGADANAVRTVVLRALAQMGDKGKSIAGKDVTLAAGAAVWIPPSSDAAEDVIRRAGTALDQARAKGPMQVEVDDVPTPWREEPQQD